MTSTNKDLYIFGTGSHARKVYNYAVAAGYSVLGFVDESAANPSPCDGIAVVDHQALLKGKPANIFIAIGNGAVRARLLQTYLNAGWKLPTIVHSTAYCAPDAFIGEGSLIAAGAVVETQVHIGQGVIIDIGSLIDHDSRVSDFTHVKTGTVLGPRSVFE